jgi:uncharacterized protein involved in outer membrane biogenesis
MADRPARAEALQGVEATPRRDRRWPWVGAGLVCAAVLGLAVGEIGGWPFLRVPVQQAMTQALGVPVLLDGHFSTRLLWQPHLLIEHINVGPAGGIAVPHLIDGRDVELAWRWGDLWRWRQGGKLRLQKLSLGVVDAHLVRAADGRASWQVGPSGLPKQAPGDEASTLSALPRFGSLVLGQGRIEVDDRLVDTALVLTLQGREGEAAGSGGGAGYVATVAGRYHALPLQLRLHTGGAMLLLDGDSESRAQALKLRVEGSAGATSVFFDGEAADLLGERRIQGALRLRGPSLAQAGRPLGVMLPQTPPFDLSGQISHGLGVWQLHAERAAIGKSLVAGDFRFDQRSSPPKLTGRLSGPRLSLADLGPAVGVPLPGTARPAAALHRVLPQREFDLPSLRAMDADVQVAVDELDLATVALAPLRSLRAQVELQGGVLQLKALDMAVAGGHISGSTQLDARGQPARWAARLHLSGIDVAGWIRAVNKSAEPSSKVPDAGTLRRQRDTAHLGGDQPVRAYLTGELTGDLDVKGQGRSTAQILASMDGSAQFRLRDGTVSHLLTELAGLDIAQSLGVLVRGDRPLPLRCARFDLVMRQGVVRPRLAVIDNSDSTVHFTGQVDLRDETLALQAQVHPKDFSLLALRAPLTVGGTLGAPRVGIEGKRLAGRALGVLAAPAAVLLPFVDTGSPESGDPCVESKAPVPGVVPKPR